MKSLRNAQVGKLDVFEKLDSPEEFNKTSLDTMEMIKHIFSFWKQPMHSKFSLTAC